ncbi:MAG: hypothetical protein K2J72_03765 [Oscillospiraceae bacterium]|nr:hypothetical protein [Oscillospiraceae bacterium]
MTMQTAVNTNPNIYLASRFDLTGKKVVDLSELFAEYSFRSVLDSKTVEINGRKIDTSTIPVADFSGRMEYNESLPNYDPSVKLGLDYLKSCFDFTNSREFNALTEAEDFTGMSDAEIYKAIYEKYQYCYGENFYRAYDIKYIAAPSDYDPYYPVLRRFDKEVMAACGFDYDNYSKLETLRKEALYGDMSDYEIREAILDKYELSDGMSFRELYQISGEMSSVGLDGDIKGYLDLLWYDFTAAPKDAVNAETDLFLIREKYFDTNVTASYIELLKRIHANRSMYGNGSPDFHTALEQIRNGVRY